MNSKIQILLFCVSLSRNILKNNFKVDLKKMAGVFLYQNMKVGIMKQQFRDF